MTIAAVQTKTTCGYAPVNGLEMYYEMEGQGDPLIVIPPTFGFAGMKSFPSLAETRLVVTVDLQGHGRTKDLPARPLSLQQYAEDVVGLLKHLGISKADFFGESYGGGTAMLIALRYPQLVGRVATYGATFGPPEIAHNPEMLRFDTPPTPDSRNIQYQREKYKAVSSDPEYWSTLWNKAAQIQWNGLSDKELAALKSPVLIVVGDRDFVRVEHAVEAFRKIPNSELAVIPDAGHFALFSEPERVIPVVKHFLNKPLPQLPVATAGIGYQPGETR
jgi:pimeloyl-ACP methyl ester carboxylesterase